MKKTITLVAALLTLVACSNRPAKQQTPDLNTFPYMVEEFADLGLLRYRVPGFEDLSVQQ